MKQMLVLPMAILGTLLLLLTLHSCAGSTKERVPSAKFAPYVNAYTGGVISQTSPIRIELTQEQPIVDLNNELKENPFHFSPSIKGKAYWINNHTIEFLPEEGALTAGTHYEASFQLGKFVEVDRELRAFEFSFRVQEKNFALLVEPIEITSTTPEEASVKGEIRFSDVVEKAQVEQMLSAQGAGGTATVVTVATTESPTLYRFSIDHIVRTNQDNKLNIKLDGHPIKVDRTIEKSILIPAKGAFSFLSAERMEQPENGIQALFSEPISETQDLSGLIEIPELSSCTFEVIHNRVNIYFEPTPLSPLTLHIHEGLKEIQGKSLGRSHSISLSEQNLKPQVELRTNAAILPESNHLILPFRAVNLHAVDLSIIRIYESNVLTFMQSNSVGEANDLRRSGRLVYKKTLPLGGDPSKEIHQWEEYLIDLSGVIKQEPGAIYRIILSFKQEYSAYPCGGNSRELQFAKETEPLTPVTAKSLSEEDDAVWDVPSTYYYYNGLSQMDWSQYEWDQRDNPCHPSYYMLSERTATCNVLASNLGMIVKRNSVNKLWITVNNLLNTAPIRKATVTIYNYQLQPIGKAQTNSDGFADIETKGVPFIAMGEAEGQKVYVRIVDGEEQSMSRFDVGGKEVQKGLKGFVYTERGVFRPGDTLHIAFMLEDRTNRIPDKHPVTLELYNPRGQFYQKLIVTNGLHGLYTFAVPTRPEDPTGTWNAYIKVGGTAFHKSLRVETVKPNRLKINLQLANNLLQAFGKEVPTLLTSAWLTGAKASNLKAKVEMSLARVNSPFENYPQYLFNNPATEYTTSRTDLFTGTLNGEGKAPFSLKLPQAANAPGMLQANITTRVFEPGGDASIYTISVPFSPFTSYVGINLHQPKNRYIETDKEHIFDLVTVTPEGKPLSRSTLEYKIYRIDWNWWWENTKESFASYVNSSSYTPVATGKLQTINGKGTFRFRVNYPDWGRYLVYVKDIQSGHATGGTVYVDWPNWRGRSGKTDPSGIKMLTFALDKESYETGETVTVLLPASAGGRALISLENGSTILQREWLDIAHQGDTKYQFKITPEMTPNVYLHISLLQPHAQMTNDLPIRMYGVMPVLVTNKATVLQPQIQLPAVLRPETTFPVTVSEKNGRPMTYTLAVVDDGLLDLTNFQTPSPWDEFYAREALGIRTWDMYDQVLGAYAGSYKQLFSTGGDETLKPSDSKANRFKPVVKFIGPFSLGKGKSQTHRIRLPMYVGSVRTMVVAGENGAYGRAEKTTPVRTPLMILSSLPRVLSTQEEIWLPVNVFAMEKEVKSANVSVKATGGVTVVDKEEQLALFTRPGDQMLYFKLCTGKKTGKATVRLTARSTTQQVSETIEIEVRNPNPAVTLVESKWLQAGESGKLTYRMESTSPENEVKLEVSRIPPVDISRRMEYLDNYPHHCSEQLISKALPLLFAAQFKAMSHTETTQVKSRIQEAIKQLYSRQLPNGGFVYWPGNASADEWITSYAGMFLTLAQEKGYAVHAHILSKWKQFQRAAAQNWRMPQTKNGHLSSSDLQQAFRLYCLALAATPEYGAMNRMKESQANLSIQAKWRLAAAYALSGKMKPANELVYNAQTSIKPYTSADGNGVYGSYDRDEAMILETLLLMNRQREAFAQAQRVSRNLQRETWFGTHSTAFALLSMGRLAEKLSGSLDFTWTLYGKPQPAVKSAKALFEKQLPVQRSGGTIAVSNQGKGVLSVDLITKQQLFQDTLQSVSKNVSLTVKYTDLHRAPLSVRQLKQGTDFIATITVANISGTSDYTHLALTHLLPSGWEILPEGRMADGTTALIPAHYTYQDIRDDRVLTYFDLKRGESKSFAIRLQATYAGTFILPAIQCEAMYDVGVRARTQAGKAVVER